jgi:hypothetical protein
LIFQIRNQRRRQATIAALSESGLFDPVFYLRRYPDVVAGGADPLSHYVDKGVEEGRNPNPFFSTSFYLERNPDVRQSGMNPLLHYVKHGFREHRQPGPDFCGQTYLNMHDDLRGTEVNPLAHYLNFGIAEGRQRWPQPAVARPGLTEAVRQAPATLPDRPADLVIEHRLLAPDMDSGPVRMTAIGRPNGAFGSDSDGGLRLLPHDFDEPCSR